jgi:hypothetical protein
MNDTQTLAISAFGLLPLAIILAVMAKAFLKSLCDRFLSEDDSPDDPISLARISSLKQEVWRRIDEFDRGHSQGFPALSQTSTDFTTRRGR